jgi:ABC-type nitrate/sulfonate/bicarbonate transport system ATPase subunit
MADFAIRNLNKIFPGQGGTVVALRDIDIMVADREFVAIVGASGSGKSTLLNLVAGFDTPTSGEILLNGAAITGPGPDRGVVFQQSALFPWLTVRGNVSFGLKLAANRHRRGTDKIDAIIRRVGLAAFQNHLPAQLSGGMRQRPAIASVLAIEPEVLLMDEPFGALDSLTRSLMQDFLLEIWEAERKTVMLVTHDINEAIYLSDRVVILAGHPGRVREVVDIDLPRPRRLATQSLPRFTELRDHVTAVVRHEVSKAEALMDA